MRAPSRRRAWLLLRAEQYAGCEMFCQNCGSPVQVSDRFCPNCGAPTSDTRALQANNSPQLAHQKNVPRIAEQERRNHYTPNDYDNYRLMGAFNRSFTTPAVITLVLYFVLWVPGFIANIVYLVEANKVQKLTGEEPEGKGCLLAMLVLFSLLFLFACVVWLFVIGAIGSAS